jgi:predicted TIM-barrel fold metal-dependent hydrolase
MPIVDRRQFLASAALAAAPPVPIIDTHIHLFDPTRPEGVPWPNKDNPVLYKPALPARFRTVAGPLGVVGAIEVECSPWLEDNQWVLDLAGKDTVILGTVGNIECGAPNFARDLERFARNPLFRGIRCGNLWNRDFTAQIERPELLADFKRMAAAGLAMDVANPNPRLMRDVVRATDRVPELRVVLDHMPRLEPPATGAAQTELDADLQRLAQRPLVFAKISAVLRRVEGRISTDPEFYRPRLDRLRDLFGPDRIIFGSDWPNSDPFGTYAEELNVIRTWIARYGRAAEERLFWRNSLAAYRWKPREASQPRA